MKTSLKTKIISLSTYTTAVIAMFAVATALIVSPSVAYAHNHGKKTPEEVIKRMTEKLTLDGDQQNFLRTLIDEKRKLSADRKAKREARKAEYKANKESGEKSKKASGPFAAIAEKDQITVADINSIIDQKHAERQERRQPALKAFVDFRNSLNTVQREQAQSKLYKMLRSIMGKKSKKGKSKAKK